MEQMLAVPPSGQNWNHWILLSSEFACFVAGEIIQVIEAMPGSVVPLAMFLDCERLLRPLWMRLFHGRVLDPCGGNKIAHDDDDKLCPNDHDDDDKFCPNDQDDAFT